MKYITFVLNFLVFSNLYCQDIKFEKDTKVKSKIISDSLVKFQIKSNSFAQTTSMFRGFLYDQTNGEPMLFQKVKLISNKKNAGCLHPAFFFRPAST